MPDRVACEICGRSIDRHASYVVRIQIFAEPSMPPLESEQLAAADFDEELDQLMKQMEGMSGDDLQDDVHRQFEYHVCRPCQRQLLGNPLGKPRRTQPGNN